MLHTDVKVGSSYYHKLDGKLWRVKITSVFEDRQRWGFEGTIDESDSDLNSSPCWGWCSELQPQSWIAGRDEDEPWYERERSRNADKFSREGY